MRFITYFFIGAGAALAALALAFVFFDRSEVEVVAPQADSETVISEAADTPKSDDTSKDVAESTEDTVVAADTNAGEETTISIDLAQVRPDGAAVFAGSAAPGARIVVFEGDLILGEGVADANGEWVVILEKNLGPGDHLVSIGSSSADGEMAVADIMLGIQVAEGGDERPLVALLPQSEGMPPKLLQSPDDVDGSAAEETVQAASDAPAATVAVEASQPPALAPRSLAWKDGGALLVSGASRGGMKVEASIGERVFGEGMTGVDGSWQIAGQVDMNVARRTMLFVLRDADGTAVASYQLPVATRDLSRGLDGSQMVVVQRGDALWRIAFSSYGEGVRFVDIVRRNASAIGDPDLIFPNQIFTIPD